MMKILYSQKAAPYVFILPFIIVFSVFFAYPLISAVVMSFQQVLPGQTTFVGFENYKILFNPTFVQAIKNSSLYMTLTLIILIPLPLMLAIFLNSKFAMFKEIFQSVIFLPALTSVVIIGMIFRMMFGSLPNSQANLILSWFGQSPIKWINSYPTAYFILVLMATWRWLGVNTLYFLAGLQNISKEYYEAAHIDGANVFQNFIYITLPLLAPITSYVITISVFAGLAMFTESFMLWNGTNSPNNIGLTIVGYLYRTGIQQNRMGIACAVGVFLLFFALCINFLQLYATGYFKKEK